MAEETGDLQFTSDELKQLFDDLNRELKQEDVTGEICIFGGATMLLVWEARELTRDVDAVFKPESVIKDAVKRVAKSNSLDKPVPGDWLNDGVKGYIDKSPDPENRELVLERSNLRIMKPPAEYLLAMKAQSARVGAEEKDPEDLEFLMRETGLTDPDEVLEIVEQYYPNFELPAKVKLFVESIAEQINPPSSGP